MNTRLSACLVTSILAVSGCPSNGDTNVAENTTGSTGTTAGTDHGGGPATAPSMTSAGAEGSETAGGTTESSGDATDADSTTADATTADSTTVDSTTTDATTGGREGLLAYYPFGGNAEDASGQGNDAELVGDPVVSADIDGIEGEAYRFDGVDDYLRIPNIANLNDDTFSVSMHFRLTNSPSDFGSDLLMDSGTFNSYLFFDGRGELKSGSYTSIGQWAYLETGVFIDAGQWYRVALTRSETETTIYVDGEKVATSRTFGFNSDVPMFYESLRSYDGSVLAADLDEFRIYDYALTPQEVAAL